jgi:hypothetical protein
MKPKAQKREEAEIRLKAYQAMTVAEKLAELDRKFGPGQGASKQRARLAAESEKKS